ncbi:MAG TPA: hypothetical protein VHU88_21100 [Sporichthyaceae bacterium]|nr:hypothetical protein [Sporichthyaceae bacterium]
MTVRGTWSWLAKFARRAPPGVRATCGRALHVAARFGVLGDLLP